MICSFCIEKGVDLPGPLFEFGEREVNAEGSEAVTPGKVSDDFAETIFGGQFLEGLRVFVVNELVSGEGSENEAVGYVGGGQHFCDG